MLHIVLGQAHMYVRCVGILECGIETARMNLISASRGELSLGRLPTAKHHLLLFFLPAALTAPAAPAAAPGEDEALHKDVQQHQHNA